MGVISPFNDDVTEPPTVERHPLSDWKLKRTYKFQRCEDTKKIIWPFTKAYYNDTFVVLRNVKVEITEAESAEWLTPAALTYRKLQVK